MFTMSSGFSKPQRPQFHHVNIASVGQTAMPQWLSEILINVRVIKFYPALSSELLNYRISELIKKTLLLLFKV